MAVSHRRNDAAIHLASASELEALLERVFGSDLSNRGLIAALQVWQRERGQYRILDDAHEDVGCHRPHLVKQVARARADAIFTTQAMLHRHPDMDHRLSGPSTAALKEWRQVRLRKPEPPVTLVLATDDAVELEHPVFQTWTRPVLLTGRQAQWQLESRACDLGIEVVGVDEPSPRSAVDFLRHAFGAATIALELDGDRTLYEPPIEVDEVLLSVCQSPQIDAPGSTFLNAEDLARGFPRHSRPYRFQVGGDVWRLQRFRR